MIKKFKKYLESKDLEQLDLSKLKNVDVMENGPGYIFYRALDVEQSQEILKIWPDIKLPLKHSDLLEKYFELGYFFFFYVTRNKTDFLFFECDHNNVLKVVHDFNYKNVKFDTLPDDVKKIALQFIKIDDDYKKTWHGVYDVDGSMETESIKKFETFTPKNVIGRDKIAIEKGLKLSNTQKMDVIEDFKDWSGGLDPTEVPMEHEEGDDLEDPTIYGFIAYYCKKSKFNRDAIEDFIIDIKGGRESIELYETFIPKKVEDRKETEIGKQLESDKRTIVTVTLSIDGKRIPGGSVKAVVEDYDLADADDSQDGFFTVTGSLWNVRNYLTDYANEHLLDVKFADEGYGLH